MLNNITKKHERFAFEYLVKIQKIHLKVSLSSIMASCIIYGHQN